MKRWQLWAGAGGCFALAVALMAWPAGSSTRRGALALAALAAALCAVALAVCALAFERFTLTFAQFRPPLRWQRIPGQAPPPPGLPVSVPLAERCLGSLRGAARALEELVPAFAAPPMLAWQFQRLQRALQAILDAAEAGEPQRAADFAVQYLPSAMQYLTACAAEGCPANAESTLTSLALAAEKQQDALAAGRYATFEQEYAALRNALQQAHFHWNKAL